MTNDGKMVTDDIQMVDKMGPLFLANGAAPPRQKTRSSSNRGQAGMTQGVNFFTAEIAETAEIFLATLRRATLVQGRQRALPTTTIEGRPVRQAPLD